MSMARQVRTVAIALTCLHAPLAVRAQVSPGPLAGPHASLDGPTACFRCHEKGTGKRGMDRLCLACHTEVEWMRSRRRGYHARVAGKACASCHPDHGGRDFALVAWDGGSPEKFDHALADYPLLGAHASLACRDCHKPAFQKSGAAPLLRVKDRGRSWLGLETACVSCHTDPHRGSLGKDCLSCHGQTQWSPAPGFDHARTAYALTGSHRKPACASCHATATVNEGPDGRGGLRPRWKPVPHQDCTPCHRDPHAGRFTGECARCHVTTSWKAVNSKRFDHDQTRYPLRGAHNAVLCDACHSTRLGGTRPKFARCADCHQDAHAGVATVQAKPVDCAVCHAVTAFEPSTWPRAAHQSTRYPLEGAHLQATCASCHTRAPAGAAESAALGSARVRIRPSSGRCVDCHHDPHAGRFAEGGARPHPGGCRACHSLAEFQPSTYDGRAHATGTFPLEGAHMAVPCQRCHGELTQPRRGSSLRSGEHRVLRFDDKERVCADCHDDAHRGQFRSRADHGACEACHDAESFTPARKFDHNRDARFRLQGAHARTPCAACHRPGPAGADGTRAVTYRPTPMRCESCHTPDTGPGPGTRPGAGSGGGRRAPILFVTHHGG